MSEAAEPDPSVFRAFDRDEFLAWPSWERVRKILRSNGGSYGISGPRGAGKSWLMRRAIDEARKPEDLRRAGLGLWYPTPSEYNALAFLGSLSDSLVNEIERRFSTQSPVWRAVSSRRMTALIALVAAASALAYETRAYTPGSWVDHIRRYGRSSSGAVVTRTNYNDIVKVLVICGIAIVVWRFAFAVLSSVWPPARLLEEARTVRARARYVTTLREASEYGAEAAHGLVGRFRRSSEQELVERPSTISSLVNDFRSLAEHAGKLAGRLVIAIDELDKMDDPTKLKDLLRDVKGIFDVPNVHFFVSVSDEAARNLNLGALTGRSEFNSSFYTVIELPPVSPSGCVDLLEQRAPTDPDVGRALAVLAGGNPREVLRLSESLANVDQVITGEAAVRRVLKDEALNLRREIVTAVAQEPIIGDEARIGSFRALPEDAFGDLDSFGRFADQVLADEMWQPAFADDGWSRAFGEAWRRLLIRLIVGARLTEGSLGDEERLLQLRDVVIAATESAAVARIVFEERIRLETRVTA